MSSCDLQVVFEREDRTHYTGELVRGAVRVRVDKPVECRGLQVRLGWETHGKGNVDRGGSDQAVVFEGRWEPDETYAYPFELSTPAFPPTIRGRDVHVDYYVHAKADIPWAFDPKTKEDLILLSTDAKGRVLAVATETEEGAVEDSISKANGAGAIFFFVLAGLGVLFPPPVNLLVIAGALFMGARLWRRAQALNKVGDVVAAVEPLRLRAGRALRIRGSIRPPKPLPVRGVAVGLSLTEVCVSGSGTNESTSRKEIWTARVPLMTRDTLPGGEDFAIDQFVEVPYDAQPSFASRHNQLVWKAFLEISPQGLPAWRRDWLLRVDPCDWRAVSEAEDEVVASEEHEPRVEVVGSTEPPLLPLESDAVPGPELGFEELTDEHVGSFEPAPDPAPVEELEVEELEVESWVEAEVDAESRPETEPDPVSHVEPAPEPDPEPAIPEPAISTQGSLPEPVASAAIGGGIGFAATLAAVEALDRFGGEREQRIEEQLGRAFDLALTMERVNWTYGDVGEAYRGGRTLTGRLADGEGEVAVRFPADQNEAVEALEPGTTVRTRARLVTWNPTYGKPEFEAEGLG